MDSLNRIHSNFTTQPLAPVRIQTEAPGSAVLDRFQAGEGGAAAPQYKDMLKLVYNSADTSKAKPDAVYTALHGKDLAGAEKALAGMQPAERLKALESLRKSHKEEYKAMLDGIHSGKLTDKGVAMGASLDQLGSTKWAGQNKSEMELLRQKYAKNEITFGETKGGDALTVPGKADAKGNRPSTITVDPKWISSPEGVASTLAHEGQHAQRYATNTLKKDLQEETDAHNKEAAVWSEFGSAKYDSKAVDKKTNPWDETVKHYDPKHPQKMMNHVAYEYISGYNRQGQNTNAKEMIEQYFDAGAGDPNLIKSASKDELAGIDAVVLNQIGKSKDDEEKVTLKGHHAILSGILDAPAK